MSGFKLRFYSSLSTFLLSSLAFLSFRLGNAANMCEHFLECDVAPWAYYWVIIFGLGFVVVASLWLRAEIKADTKEWGASK